MKKVLFVLITLLFIAGTTQGQGKGKTALSIGADVAIATGDAADLADLGTGFGGTVKFEYGVSKNLVIVGTAGYLTWGGSETTQSVPGFGSYTAKWTWSAIPVFAGVKYYFGKTKFYAMGELGLHFFTFDLEVTGFSASGSTTESEFGFAFGAGYEIPVGKSGAVDIGAKYVIAASDFSFIDIRAGYKFAL